MLKSDEYILKVESYLLRKYGSNQVASMTAPLWWYVNTGRASVTFLNLLYGVKPYCIGKVLARGGSYDEAIQRVRERIGLPKIDY